MRFDVLTLFPESMDAFLNESIIGRARQAGFLDVRTHNIRSWSTNRHGKVDDYAFGGGTGMVMSPQPVMDAWRAVTAELGHRPKTLYMSPQGRVLTQEKAKALLNEPSLLLICGHYEGLDERVLEAIVDEEISIGDYVLTGGELPAMVLIDCIGRMVPGVLPNEEAFSEESHFDGLLEYPHYTRPAEFEGRKVPDILLSGHHVNVGKWRFLQQLERTKAKRPDMYEAYEKAHPERIAEAYGLNRKPKRVRSKRVKEEVRVDSGMALKNAVQTPETEAAAVSAMSESTVAEADAMCDATAGQERSVSEPAAVGVWSTPEPAEEEARSTAEPAAVEARATSDNPAEELRARTDTSTEEPA